MKLGIVSLLLTILSSVCVSQKLEKLVRAIADGEYNGQLAKIWEMMEAKAFKHRAKSNRPYQYLIAAHIYQNSDHKLKYIEEDIKYYTNIDVQQANEDCDSDCKKKVNEIRTKIMSTDTLEKLSKLKTRCDTAVHTELQFLYGKGFRGAMCQGGIFVIYSYHIPCAGLAGCSLGECAGDLAYGLVDLRMRTGKPLYFVIMYTAVFKRQRGVTNECVSKLYHANAGIPLLHCYQSGAMRACEVAVGTDQFFHGINSIRSPVFHRFPRINKADEINHRQADVFIRCLAMGEFMQKLEKRGTNNRMGISSDALYLEDEKNAYKIASRLVKRCGKKRYNIDNVRQILRSSDGKEPSLSHVIDRCDAFIGCLEDLSTSDSTLMTDAAASSRLSDLSMKDKSSKPAKDEL